MNLLKAKYDERQDALKEAEEQKENEGIQAKEPAMATS